MRPISQAQAQSFLHAALAANVAAWDVYVKAIIREFFGVVANPAVPAYFAMHKLGEDNAIAAMKKMHNPNWQNARDALVALTGYDPISDWVWPARHMNAQAVRSRSDEIVKVRHGFAHGSPIPAFSWTILSAGKVALTSKSVKDVEAFFRNLVSKTDRGPRRFLATTYSVRVRW